MSLDDLKLCKPGDIVQERYDDGWYNVDTGAGPKMKYLYLSYQLIFQPMRQFIEWKADSFEAFQGQGHGKEEDRA